MRRSTILLPAALLVLEAGCPAPAAPPGPSFRNEVRPLLAAACFGCHGPDANRRKGGVRLDTREGLLAVVSPGRPDRSALWSRVSSPHPEELMPPPGSNRTLSPAQIDLLRRWILAGAPWEPHWAYAPLAAAPVPSPRPGWGRNEIDAFVAARLAAEGLSPSPEADRPTLARRLALDLNGLPPTPEEVDAFVADGAPDAVERLADRLLASPRYGEHMARLWMDLARFGDTQGLQVDAYRELWPYRDWVIRAFNANLPYDRFVRLQLAGDLLPGDDRDARIATGFLRAHVVTGEGGVLEEEARCRNVFDRVETFGQAFLGLALSCARCHDHKFDPVTQKEYYGLFAFFNSLDGPELSWNLKVSPPFTTLPAPEEEAALARNRAEAAALEARLRGPDAALDALQPAWERELAARLAAQWKPLRSLGDGAFEVRLETPVAALRVEGGEPPAGALLDGRPVPLRAVGPVLLPDAPLGPGLLRLPAPGLTVSATTDAELLKGAVRASFGPWWLAGPFPAEDGFAAFDARLGPEDGVDPSRPLRGQPWRRGSEDAEQALPPETGTTYAYRTIASPTARSLTIRLANDDAFEVRLNGSLLASSRWPRVYAPDKAAAIRLDLDAGENALLIKFANHRTSSRPRFSIETASEEADDLLQGVAESLALQAPARSAEQAAALRERFRRERWPEWPTLRRALSEKQKEGHRLFEAVPHTLIMRERREPLPAHVLKRGEYDRQGEAVARHTPAALPPWPAGAPLDRRGLADWILQPRFPLAARVAVNRAWQQLFGAGLVRSSEDFGLQGEPPSHPELLDRLAADFVAGGWDIKALLKRVVGSAAYRQSSRVTPELLRRDPENRLLARGPRFRLDAETLRDQALFLSGLLVERAGGPSVKAPQPKGLWESVSFGASDTSRFSRDREPEKAFRRSLYLFWKRTAPPPQMALFDAPSRETCVSRRERTCTPLQALVLLNEPQYAEAARHLAQRALREAGPAPEDRAAWLLRRCTLRPAAPEDAAELAALARVRREAYERDPAAARALVAFGDLPADGSLPAPELAAWTQAAAVVLNLDDVLNRR